MYTGTKKAAQITGTLLPLFFKFEESIEQKIVLITINKRNQKLLDLLTLGIQKESRCQSHLKF